MLLRTLSPIVFSLRWALLLDWGWPPLEVLAPLEVIPPLEMVRRWLDRV
jgi:hypothetical protein